ncbi:MAG: SUMF1/EgtB/PvdO family nonheme iron enzyme [Pseudomonadota bacterium]
MNDVFISYAREDKARVQGLAERLAEHGWSVFWDHTIPAGQTWRARISEALSQVQVVVVVWTAASVESQFVLEEAAVGRRRGVLLPVLFEPVAPPFGFAEIQSLDLSRWNGERDHPTFQRLCRRVNAELERERPQAMSGEGQAPRLGPHRAPNPMVSRRPMVGWLAAVVFAMIAGGALVYSAYERNRMRTQSAEAVSAVTKELNAVRAAYEALQGEQARAQSTLASTSRKLSAANDAKDKLEQILARLRADRALPEPRVPEVVLIPAGRFSMGDSITPGARTQTIEIPESFSIMVHEVTFEAYDLFALWTQRRLPNDEGWGRRARPVINVSWRDANAYAAWLSERTGDRYQLPSEAQWEFAARAGATTRYWWGNDPGEARANCADCGASLGGETSEVGQFRANRYGLFDVHGNVAEWVQDCFRRGGKAPSDGRAFEDDQCATRVIRDGAFHQSAQRMIASARTGLAEHGRSRGLGFRLVKSR